MTIELKHKAEGLESVLYTAQMCLGIWFKYSLFIQVGLLENIKDPQNNILVHF